MLEKFYSNFPGKGIRNLRNRDGHKDENSEKLAAKERHTDENSEKLAAKERHTDEISERLAAKGCEIFSYKTLLAATDSFNLRSERQDSDDFRSIYKGKLKDGREVEVERFTSQTWKHGRKEFLEEAELLNKLQHPNVVKLLGYCADKNEFLLVYEYLPINLQQLLCSITGREQLNWTKRYEIIKGIVNGLSYLHGGSQTRSIFHGDISTRNILLDHELKPIICGFYRANHPEFSPYDEIWPPTDMLEKWGHMAPEFLALGEMSVKTDVYGFGVLLLELITGKSFAQEGMLYYKFRPLIDRAYQLLVKNRSLELLDPTLADSVVTEQVTNCITIALLCSHTAPHLRPSMSDVLYMLPRDQDNKVEESMNFGSEILLDMPMNSNSLTVPTQDDREGQKDANLKEKVDAQNCQRFSYEALHDATNGFASQNVLGQGGFGLVYEGKLDDGREIAVKKSSNMSERHRAALITEVELLSSVKHPNVVKLFGYCDDNNEFLLVYEFVPNKSLSKLLFGPKGREQELDWTRTYGIIIGIARGLSYLHGSPQNCIIHRDIKPDNILIDHKWLPKISDFGISRLFEEDQTHVYTQIVGTWGYMAPEYLDNSRVSIKTDVYSFGVLVLELISGRRCSYRPPPEDNAVGLLDWVYKLFKAGRISEIIDPTLANSAITEQVKKCIEMGLLCTQGHPNSRPNMERCVFMLSSYQDQREVTISRPGVFGYRGYRSGPLSALVEATQNQATNIADGMSVDEHQGKDRSLN